jgi:hypothetical protein
MLNSKMKKNCFRAGAIILLGALTTGCARETVEIPDNTDRKIAYKAAFGTNRPVAETRASEMNYDKLIANNAELPVWVYFRTGTSTSELFNSWSLTHLTTPVGHWSYNNDVDVIHPQDELVHFSVWPFTANVTTAGQDGLDGVNAASGEARFDYKVPELHSDQEDLLVARAYSIYSNPAAAFTYAHALSQINFSVKGYTGVKITIGDIKMGGIHDKGTYSFGTGGWSDLTGEGTYNYAISPERPGDPVGQTSGLDDREVFFGNHDAGTDAEKDIRHDNSLMLLPQNFEENTAAWFSFDYTLTNMDGIVLKSGDDVRVSLKDLLIDNNDPVWEGGRRYRYTIRFNTLNTISYTVDMNPWTVGNQAPVVQ